MTLCFTESSGRVLFLPSMQKVTSNWIMLLFRMLLNLEQNWFTAREDRKQIHHHSAQLLEEASTELPKIGCLFLHTSRFFYYFSPDTHMITAIKFQAQSLFVPGFCATSCT